MSLLRRAYSYVHFRMKYHKPFQLAAQVAFFFLLATQPLLIVLTALVAYLPLGTFQARIVSFFAEAFPGAAGEKLSSVILQVFEQKHPRLLSGALVALLWTASSGTKSLIDAVSRIRGLPADPRKWIHVRLRAVGITVVLLVFVAVGGSIAAGVLDLVSYALDGPGAPFAYHRLAELALGFLLMTSGVQLLYRFGPPPPRQPALPGAVVAVVSAVAASFGLSVYIGHVRDVTSIYGSLGALILLVLWFYVAGCALVLGAEVNVAIAEWRQGRDETGGAGAATRSSLPVGRQARSSAS